MRIFPASSCNLSRISLLLTVMLGACANASTIADEPLRTGDSHAFAASYETMKSIVPKAIKATGVGVTQQSETPEGYVILTSQGVTAFSWGYVGRVFVERSPTNNSTVYVNLERRFSTISNDRYPNKLFKEITAELPK